MSVSSVEVTRERERGGSPEPRSAEQTATARSPQRFPYLKGALSALVCFHLAAILTSPIKETYLGQKIGRVTAPYLNTFEFTSAWGFFAPDPGPPPVFMEWELMDQRGEFLERGQWPDRAMEENLFRERFNRRMAMVRLLIASDEQYVKVMIPYLCRQFPAAHSIRLSKVAYSIPSSEEVLSGKRKIGDDQNQDRRNAGHHFCER